MACFCSITREEGSFQNLLKQADNTDNEQRPQLEFFLGGVKASLETK